MVLIGGAALWIEYEHRTVTDAPTSTELDALAAARACPDSENMPYTATCLAFLNGSAASERRANAPESVSAEQPSATSWNRARLRPGRHAEIPTPCLIP
jgi:hypothetical protein